MEKLRILSAMKVQAVEMDFQRYLLDQIDWSDRLIAIKGARGSGKTILLLQHIKKHLPLDGTALYVAMDDLFFTDNNLLSLAEEFYMSGGRYLLIDEVHKYPNWSRELKLMYDNFPKLKIVFTSSSILEIYAGESDLSRRAVTYDLRELSLREFIELDLGLKLPMYSLQTILEDHVIIASELNSKIQVNAKFLEYLRYGVYPFFKESKVSYLSRLRNTIQLIIDVDLNAVENLNYDILVKLKKLSRLIATSAPFTPNITELSNKLGISRPSLLKSLDLLEKARIIQSVNKVNSGTGILTKPDKVFLNNPNILYALGDDYENKGTVRETFFVNQVKGIAKLNLAPRADFLLDEFYTIEIGGPNKGKKQISKTENAFLLKDNIEIGFGNTIPLWLFGFLY
ncbi:ATP-binding protein [Belliella aquatica]|nr:AAA family ATPase [Belliella aquatica]MCH7405308.1 AAA family ATPase [Belliella aquatica]